MRTERGVTLIEVLGAVLILSLLGGMVALGYVARLELLRELTEQAEARPLADALERALAGAFRAAGRGATSVDWHFEGIADRWSLPATGSLTLPVEPTNLDVAAPRWRVYPLGRPELPVVRGVREEAGGLWRIVAPIGGAAEADPSTPGWDANRNGVRDRPDTLAAGSSGVEPGNRRWSYGIEIVAGTPYRVTLALYRDHVVRGRELLAGRLVLRRMLELVPGEDGS